MLYHKKDFERVIDGRRVQLYTLRHGSSSMQICNYGAILVQLNIFSQERSVVVGFPSLEDYLPDDTQYFGAIIGPYANRIARASYTIEGHTYHIPKGAHGHYLHGGPTGTHRQVWTVTEITSKSITLELLYPGRDYGFSANVKMNTRYTLTTEDSLLIEISATPDAIMPISMTNHAYFNLSGDVRPVGTANHHLQINSDSILVTDDQLIPTGDIKKVAHTSTDFRKMRHIGNMSYDHTYLLNKLPQTPAAIVLDNASKLQMEVYTNQPTLQLYSGHNAPIKLKKSDIVIPQRSSFCLEAQGYPDGVQLNMAKNVFMRAGSKYQHRTIFKYSDRI